MIAKIDLFLFFYLDYKDLVPSNMSFKNYFKQSLQNTFFFTFTFLRENSDLPYRS